MALHSLGNTFLSDSSRFASLDLSVHPRQDFPLDHCGIISLVGHLRGKGPAVRSPQLRKEKLNKELLPCVAFGLCGLHRNSTFYLTRMSVCKSCSPTPLSSPHLPAPEPQPLWGKKRGCPPEIEPELETSFCELGSPEQNCWLPLLPEENLRLQFLQFTSFIKYSSFLSPRLPALLLSKGTTYFPNPFCIISFIYYFYVFYWVHVHIISLRSPEQLTMSWEPSSLSKGS